MFAEREFVFIASAFGPVETVMLDEVPEYRVNIESLPAPKVTWIKDGTVLGNVAAEISTRVVRTGETR